MDLGVPEGAVVQHVVVMDGHLGRKVAKIIKQWQKYSITFELCAPHLNSSRQIYKAPDDEYRHKDVAFVAIPFNCTVDGWE